LKSGLVKNALRRILYTACALVMSIRTVTYGAGSNLPANVHARPAAAVAQQNMTLKIRLTVNEKTVVASLADNPTARDFHSLLPFTLTLDDYAATEKISYLPRKLAKDGAPAGIDPAIGDIAYYAPWGNLAIFYKDFGYSKGLIKLGTISSGLEALTVSGSVKVRIEPVAE
jgi:hypothetical protein